MKKFYNLLFVLGVPVTFLLFTSGVLFHDGSPGGKTGSPGDNGANCTGCHSDNPVMNEDLWIYSSQLESSGYLPGQTYDVIVSAEDPNANKFGFEATAEDNSGNKTGSFTAGAGGLNQTINSGSAITHTALGNTPSTGSGTTWSFTWTAPTTNVGSITMYTAVNAADGTGGTGGDQIHLSQFTFSASTVGIDENKNESSFKVFPVPSSGLISISNIINSSDDMVYVVNLMGQIAFQSELTENNFEIDLSELEKGIYIVKIGNSSQRIILH